MACTSNYQRVIGGILGGQLIVAAIFDSPFSLIGFIAGYLLTMLFTLLFPIWTVGAFFIFFFPSLIPMLEWQIDHYRMSINLISIHGTVDIIKHIHWIIIPLILILTMIRIPQKWRWSNGGQQPQEGQVACLPEHESLYRKMLNQIRSVWF